MAPKMPETKTFTVPETASGARLDVFVAGVLPDISRSRAQKLIESGRILVDGKPEKASYKLLPGETVLVTIPPPEPMGIKGEDIPIEIIYEDEDILVVNKPRGMAVHPAPGSPSRTLVNALLARCDKLSSVGGTERPGIVHRLDKDTSGALVVAKTDAAHASLQQQIQKREARRAYKLVVHGEVKFTEAEIDAPIGRHPTDRKRMAVLEFAEDRGLKARRAVTDLRVLKRFRQFTYLEARLQTGRTHQIRVHTSYIGHPVVGDPVYGANRLPLWLGRKQEAELKQILKNLSGQALHAAFLTIKHPRTGIQMTFEAPMPSEFEALLKWLEQNAC